MIDNNLWGLECVKEFSPYFKTAFTVSGKKENIESKFTVKVGEKFRVHDKVDDMWEVSYNNGRLFWTDIEQIRENCISISGKELDRVF